MNTLAHQIRALRDTNTPNDDIAAQLGITIAQLSRMVTKHQMPPKKKPLCPEYADKLREMYMSGLSQSKIAKAVGENENKVGDHIRKMGLPPRRRVPSTGKSHVYEVVPDSRTDTPYAHVTGLDGELLRCGRNEAQRAVIAGRYGLSLTHARLLWFRLMKEYEG